MGLRPLFGSRASVNNVRDSFGTTVEQVKSSESEHADPLNQAASNQAVSAEQPHQPQDRQGLAGLLNAAALVSDKDAQSTTEDHHDHDDLVAAQPQHTPQPVALDASHDDAAAWKQSRTEAETSDQRESARASSKFGRTLKKFDAKIRTKIGVNPPPTAQEIKSPYSIGNDEHLTSHNHEGAAELLNDAQLETLQHLSDDDADDDDDDDQDEEEDDDQDHQDHDATQPDAASIQKHVDELERTKKDAEKRRSGSMDGARPGDTVRTHAPAQVSAEDKMKAIIEEFGECPSLSQPNEPEKLLVDHNGVLMKTVLIKGSLFLTNRRLCFLAYIPNAARGGSEHDTPSNTDSAPGGMRAPHDPNVQNPILKSGPAVIHRPGKMRAKRRVWIELRRHSFNAYAASNKLYKPLLSARLSNLSAVLPIDWAHPNVIRFVDGSKDSSVEFKTQEAALDWRKELEAAAFHSRNTSDKVRISIPLERIVGLGAADFMQVAKVIHVDLIVGAVSESEQAQFVQEHRERAERRQLDHSWSGNDVFYNCPKDPGFKCHTTQVAFGITHNRIAFLDLLREAIKKPQTLHKSAGFRQTLQAVPAPLLDLDTDADAEETSTDGNSSSDDQKLSLAEKFCRAFGLPDHAEQLHIVKAELVRTLHTHGTLAIGLDYLLFWRRAVSRDLKVKVPLNDLQGVDTYRSMLWHHFGLVVHIRAHSDMFFDFTSKQNRDLVLSTLKRVVEAKQTHKDDAERASVNTASDGSHATKVEAGDASAKAGGKPPASVLLNDSVGEVPVFEPEVLSYLPRVVNLDRDTMRNALRVSPMRIYCLTIGSRGDVQPYIALCKALKQHGHTPVIVSHPEYRGWVEGHGIEYRGVGGDPAALMKLSVEHRIFSPAFFKESIGKFRVWLDELLRECWEECQGADLLIESPSTMAGIHVAEGLGIPYFRAFTMPWTKTSAYPQAFSVPSIEMGPSYNSSSYTLFDQIMWVATSGQINRWRKHMVGIGPTDWSKLDAGSVPFIYNFSPAVVPMPNDWGDRVKISGYWFLDNPENNWTPPKEMSDFLERARKDGKKIAYIGFGSITIENAEEVSGNIMQAVRSADVRAIVAKGWSGRGGSKPKKKKPHMQHHNSSLSHTDAEDTATEDEQHEVEIPDDVFVVDSVPHDWLFPQIDIAMHHGGAGTTGASLRAGLVTLIKPFFGDQFFWANRVQKLGAGARVNGLSVSDLTDSLKSAASDRVMVEKAQGVGEKIRSEDGVSIAIEFLYKNISLANRRTQRRLEREATAHPASPSDAQCSNPLSRLASHGRQNSGERHPHRAASLPTESLSPSPLSPSQEAGLHRSTSTIVESPAGEDGDTPTGGTDSPTKTGKSLLPSMSTLNMLPSSMAASLKEMVTLNHNTNDTTADGEEAPGSGLGDRSRTAPSGALVGEETEEQKMARLKGYKNAKAEDIRRRKLLLERLEREKRKKVEQQRKEAAEKKADAAGVQA
ncbi:probable Ugt53a1-UDP-glucose:sterol glucosyltransferase Ugt53A1 [Sporisorium reilianum SRZ2]|uniref:Probable Ugt53a1-UDP-glucose:sterol glucosyltransferase Ugt53A1 n=1 Tax=Sporisorium reilianum (strain SRZ2) TaxID=999809 RepID=E7A088_SPORE|nr:probable Ugt53a1-UDP-glucose:sterol glucosyltransferase Ugt53A1 [Sporisorium reilianum SRZ2]